MNRYILAAFAVILSSAIIYAQGNQEAANLTKEGIEASKANDWEKAVNAFRRATQLEARYAPNLISALRHRAIAFRTEGKFPEAAADLSEAIKLKKDDPDIFEQRGYIELQMKDYDKALGDYTEAIKLQPKEMKYYLVRAVILQSKGDFKAALADVDKVLQADPNNADAQTRKRFLQAKLNPAPTPVPTPVGPIANPNAAPSPPQGNFIPAAKPTPSR